MKKIIIISANSDIGVSLSNYFIKKKLTIFCTYRKNNFSNMILNNKKSHFHKLDLSSNNSINIFCKSIKRSFSDWDTIIFCNGDLNPIGKFLDLNFKDWKNSFNINCLSILQIINQLLKKNKKKRKLLFFSGSGTNSAVEDYSAYTLSKILLIKFTELLDFEEKKISTCILGPGWLNTKIHQATIKSKIHLKNKKFAKKVLKRDDTKKMIKLNKMVNWILNNIEILSGRNLSLDYDNWGNQKLLSKLNKNINLYKLRRFGN